MSISRRHRVILPLAVMALAALLCGCVAYPAYPGYYGEGYYGSPYYAPPVVYGPSIGINLGGIGIGIR